MRRLLTPVWLLRHLVAATLVGGFLALGWWQIGRAAAGNSLSWAYAVEWPVFAGFVVFVWWREVRRDRRVDSARTGTRPTGDGQVPANTPAPGFRRPVTTSRRSASPAPVPAGTSDSPELDAYNAYLAWLNANPTARPGDYPG